MDKDTDTEVLPNQPKQLITRTVSWCAMLQTSLIGVLETHCIELILPLRLYISSLRMIMFYNVKTFATDFVVSVSVSGPSKNNRKRPKLNKYKLENQTAINKYIWVCLHNEGRMVEFGSVLL